MAKPEKPVTEQQKKSIIEQLWLHYYNQTSHDKGMIFDEDYTRMKVKINSRKASSMER